MDETKTIAWQLIVETKGIQQNTKAAADSLDGLMSIAKQARATIIAVIASEAVKQVIELSDAYVEFQNRLRLATTGVTQLNAVSQDIAKIAAENSVSIESAAEAYNNFHQALETSGASANDVLQVVDLVQKTVALSGQTAEQAAGEMQHFALALQSGSLNARDVTTLFKQIPELGNAIAAGLGVSIDKMKSLAAEGKLTTKAVTDALEASAPDIQQKFASLTPTFKQAFTSLYDGVKVAFGALDDGIGITAEISKGMVALGKELVALGPKLHEVGLDIQDFFTNAGIKLKTFFASIPLADALGTTEEASNAAADALAKLNDQEKISLLQADLDSAARHAAARKIADDMDTRGKAVAQETDAEIKAAKSYQAELDSLEHSIEETAIKQAALNTVIAFGANAQREGAQAANDATVRAEAQLAVTNKVAEAIRTAQPFNDKQVASMRAAASAAAENTIAVTHQAEATKLAFKAQTDWTDSIDKSNKQLAEATITSNALTIEISQGTLAAEAYAKQQEAELDVIDKVHQQLKDGLPITADYIAAQLKLADSTTAVTTATAEQSQAWQRVKSAIDSSLTPQESAAKSLKELTDAYAKLSDEQKLALDPAMVKAYEQQVAELSAKTSTNFGLMHDSVMAFANDFTNFLTDGAFDFKQFATSLIKDIAKLIIEFEILKLIGGAFPGFGIGAGAAAPAAMGAAYNQGNILPFAAGGVVGGPVTFGLAGGRTGLMGEAGPEAVMPLQRMSGGQLGVKGATPNISIINKTGVPARARIQQQADRTSIVLEAAQLGAQMAEDRMTRSMRNGYGPTASAMQSTYQLRRRGG